MSSATDNWLKHHVVAEPATISLLIAGWGYVCCRRRLGVAMAADVTAVVLDEILVKLKYSAVIGDRSIPMRRGVWAFQTGASSQGLCRGFCLGQSKEVFDPHRSADACRRHLFHSGRFRPTCGEGPAELSPGRTSAPKRERHFGMNPRRARPCPFIRHIAIRTRECRAKRAIGLRMGKSRRNRPGCC